MSLNPDLQLSAVEIGQFLAKLYLLSNTLENHCTRTAQSWRGGCSRRVHKIEYLTVNKGNILVNFLLLKKFIVNYYY